jgi:hypothetical protein
MQESAELICPLKLSPPFLISRIVHGEAISGPAGRYPSGKAEIPAADLNCSPDQITASSS